MNDKNFARDGLSIKIGWADIADFFNHRGLFYIIFLTRIFQ